MDESFFKAAGDIAEPKNTDSYFRPATEKVEIKDMKGYFEPAGDLVEPKNTDIYFRPATEKVEIKDMKGFFEPAGDLVEPKNMDSYFRPATEKVEIKDMKGYFEPAGDLESNTFNNYSKDYSVDEVKDYLLTVVSGQRFGSECELGTLSGQGSMIVSFDRLKDMVNNGYNIVKAECINPNVIAIEFQEYKKDGFRRKF